MLEVFDATTSYNKRGKPPIVNIHSDGRISFSVEAVKLLQIEPTDKLSFAYDNRDREIIYFYRSDNGVELKQVTTVNGAMRLMICCRPLSRNILNFFTYKNHKSFKVKNETTILENGYSAWFIQR